jgi:hypothetical protein
MIRYASVIAASVLLVACSTPYTRPLVVPHTAQVPGIADSMERAGAGRADVVSMHGMCTHTYDSWVVPAVAQLADAFDVESVNIEEVFAHDGLKLFRARLSTSAGDVTHYSIVWSSISAAWKQTLCYDNSAYPDGYSGVCSDAPYPYKRANINEDLKSTLLNDCLSDVTVYLGAGGVRIRAAVREALEFIDQERSSSEPLFLITESLGSRVIYDALSRQDAAFTMSQLSDLAESLAATEVIYMAANQLPLLDIALGADPAAQPDATRQLMELLDSKRKSMAGLDDDREIVAVAFTDPNDLLSYTIPANSDLRHINVIVSNNRTWFGMFENPWPAHTGYLDNERVWALIVNGN